MAQLDADDAFHWWKAGVIYQVYPRSFQDSNGDGVGDLPGIVRRLDYLAELGVDAVWISPFYRSPMKDFGYDVADYCDVDPVFGTLADFDALVAGAHERSIRILVDWVPNHCSDQHPWFRSSRSSRADARRDWFTWRDPGPDGAPPNNWLAVFGGPAWTLDPQTGQFYLHSFLPEQPDLNWRNPHVRGAMLETLRFWLDRGVDGFRIDVAHYLMKDPLLRDNPPADARTSQFHKNMGDYDSQVHVYDRNHPDIHDLYREIRALLDSYSTTHPRASIGEIHLFDLQEWARFYGQDLDELHMPFNFSLLRVPWDAAAVRRTIDALEAALPPRAWPNWVLGNHDEPRIASRVGPDAARAAMVLLLTMRGTPTLYYGDELGMMDVPIPEGRQQDPYGKRVPGLGLGRDPERTPMQWDGSPTAGFTQTGVAPWLPLAADADRRNVAVQRADPASMLVLTQRLLAARRTHAALHRGTYRPYDEVPDGVFGFLREHQSERLLVLVNFRSAQAEVAIPDGVTSVAISTHPSPSLPGRGATLALRPDEALVLTLGG
ncbi:MAG TPA: alpha-amylase family glycosyl hydrolase [Kofleriaceae bacterium]|nr:alpha-amylase family glycosyl hydrolase [Kofleriaceae bacterium]